MYVIVDLETSGGNPLHDRIVEIAAYLFDGERIVDELVTLIDPETNIPAYITSLTGISNAMVAGAPKFYEVAKKLVKMTEGCVFVAHNAPFDYGFIRNEFKHFLNIARGSTIETMSHLEIALMLGFINSDEYKVLNELADRISAMLYKLINSLQ